MSFEKDCTIIVKTIYRPVQLLETIRAWRKFYPKIRIIVLDDGDDAIENMINCIGGIEYIAAPFDIGLSAGRNILVSFVKTPYFFLTDDDDMPCGRDFDDVFLETIKSGFDIVGVRVGDHVVNFNITEDGKEFRLGLTPIEDKKDFYVIPCNIVHNIFIAKKDTAIPWPAQIKLGEHMPYFIDSQSKNIKVGLHSKKIPYKIVSARPSEKYNSLRSRGSDLKIAYFKLFTDIEHAYIQWRIGSDEVHLDIKDAKLNFTPDTRLNRDIVVLTKENKYLINPNLISKPVICQQVEVGWNFVHIPGTDSVHLDIEAILADIKWRDNKLENTKINCFTIVRNPYDRMIAVAKDFYRSKGGDIDKLTNEKINDIISNNINNGVNNINKGGINFKPQVNFSKSANKIFHHERGFGEIQEFFDQEGINISVLGKKLRYENKFKLTPKTKKLIYKMHGIDFKTFGYKE